jgi:hypothetical protein
MHTESRRRIFDAIEHSAFHLDTQFCASHANITHRWEADVAGKILSAAMLMLHVCAVEHEATS